MDMNVNICFMYYYEYIDKYEHLLLISFEELSKSK